MKAININSDLYERRDTPSKGRHLIAKQTIEKGQLVFVERPLLSLQSLGNAHSGALVCRCCRAFVGGPNLCLGVASGRILREHVLDVSENSNEKIDSNDNKVKHLVSREKEQIDDCYKIIPCRRSCGELYCSKKCEEDMWSCYGHQLLCTGLIPDPRDDKDENMKGTNEGSDSRDDVINEKTNTIHPLLQFKVHAVQNNEILLMVADLIATVVSLRQQQIQNEAEQQQQQKQQQQQQSSLSDIMSPYLDFTLVPWWEVATAPLLTNPAKFKEVVVLEKTLRNMCDESARLLKKALLCTIHEFQIDVSLSTGSKKKRTATNSFLLALQECSDQYDMFSELFFGKIIGSFEQNAMGIRARHPLCRDILEQKDVREHGHVDLVRCIEKAGMVGDNVKEDEVDDVGVNNVTSDESEHGFHSANNVTADNDLKPSNDEANTVISTVNSEASSENSCYNNEFSIDDIAGFLASLDIDEEGYGASSNNADFKKTMISVCENAALKQDDDDDAEEEEEEEENSITEGDDLDALFTPLDGTAMYYMACKMNHSCQPNILARYSYSCHSGGGKAMWGEDCPLVLQCVALRDIKKNEELCISYIQSDLSFDQRREALQNYGFCCNCVRCEADIKGKDSVKKKSDLAGDDKLLCPEQIYEDIFSDDGSIDERKSVDETDDKTVSGEELIRKCLEQMNKKSALSHFGHLPIRFLAPTVSFISQVGKEALHHLEQMKESRKNSMSHWLRTSLQAVSERDFVRCIKAGVSGETHGLDLLQSFGEWPNAACREAYGCCAVTAAIGYANYGIFIPALKVLDKTSIFGLPRDRIKELFSYVEYHATCSFWYHRLRINEQSIVPDYKQEELQALLVSVGMSTVLKWPVEEIHASLFSLQQFNKSFVSVAKPVIIRDFASSWPAIQKWRNLDYFLKDYAHRIVPIEIGIMSEEKGMKERLMTIRSFITSFLFPSNSKKVWQPPPLRDIDLDSIAYLAQHQLFEHIPGLILDIDKSPFLCGRSGPSHVNVWIGTGGTRTPLHFDTYDNLFVQVVGSKYVRLYGTEETHSLYVMDQNESLYGKQGNMSALDCECEDFEDKHQLAKNAKYTEVLMLPGDCLFIPARTWHYVRGLTTSISVNFWW